MRAWNALWMRRLLAPRTMLRWARLPLAMLVLCAPSAVAQSNLGQVLDAGGKLLSLEEFKQELVQRALVGPTPSGGNLEIMYTSSGRIQGIGAMPGSSPPMGTLSPYDGTWTDGENGAVCATLVIRGQGGQKLLPLPRRCQFWFKVGERYYLSDSDTDRSARVLVRTIKQR